MSAIKKKKKKEWKDRVMVRKSLRNFLLPCGHLVECLDFQGKSSAHLLLISPTERDFQTSKKFADVFPGYYCYLF